MNKTIIGLVVGFVLTGCGFKLRNSVDLPAGMQSVYIEGVSPISELVQNLQTQLAYGEGRIIHDPKDAGLIIAILDQKEDRRVISLDNQGKANEFRLIYRLRFALRKGDGKELVSPQEVTITKEYFNDQVDVIGKSDEEATIRREMHKEAVRRVMDRANAALNKGS